MSAPYKNSSSSLQTRYGVLIFWLMAALAVPVWIAHDSSAWDVRVYDAALKSIEVGHDPYVDATTIQKQHHVSVAANSSVDTGKDPPYSYVYSPVTLILLRSLANVPRHLLLVLYWSAYVVCTCLSIAVCVWFGTKQEQTPLLYMAGIAAFFPGLLANGTVLGGNIAYILYGFALLAAWFGWRRSVWRPFYAVVLAASCFKAPLLSLALIPALSARKQWLPSLATIAVGIALFASQSVLWPNLFRHYLEAVELQFSFNHDFGCSPAGLLSEFLYAHGRSYSPASSFFYAAYAIPVLCALVYLSRTYLKGAFQLREWAPVLLLGIILLNPRIMEYDVAPVTLAMALVCSTLR